MTSKHCGSCVYWLFPPLLSILYFPAYFHHSGRANETQLLWSPQCFCFAPECFIPLCTTTTFYLVAACCSDGLLSHCPTDTFSGGREVALIRILSQPHISRLFIDIHKASHRWRCLNLLKKELGRKRPSFSPVSFSQPYHLTTFPPSCWLALLSSLCLTHCVASLISWGNKRKSRLRPLVLFIHSAPFLPSVRPPRLIKPISCAALQ